MNAGLPLVEELRPCPDSWTVARQLAHLPQLLFLDSAEKHPERGRYSYVSADVPLTLAGPAHGGLLKSRSAFDSVLKEFQYDSRPAVPGLPPFQGGLAGVFAYDMGREIERRVPEPRRDEFQLPQWALGFYDWLVAFDHAQGRAWIVAHDIRRSPARSPVAAAQERIDRVKAILREPPRPPLPIAREWPAARPLRGHELTPQFPLPGLANVTSNFAPGEFVNAVQGAIDYIHAGDCFQVNLSQRLLAPLEEHPLELYARLRERSPAPFAGYFDAGEFQLLSASPERFLKVTHGTVETRPIKGTRPRGSTPAEDAAQIADLLASPKDRAENVMIVDLLRNDLGRVCEFGSVNVTKLCEVESFRQVHHLVSEVRGQLRSGQNAFDLLQVAFPGGSVTGAPKVRAMEIIAELEPTARGPYCGALGYIGFDGACDTNILIRTMTAARGWVQFPVGGGIVADSDPQREYEETLHKAAGMLRALERP